MFEEEAERQSALKPIEGDWATYFSFDTLLQTDIDETNRRSLEKNEPLTFPATTVAVDEFQKWLLLEKPDMTQEDVDKQTGKFESLVMYAHRVGSHTTAIPAGGVGYVQYQAEGSRIFASLSVKEAEAVFGSEVQDRIAVLPHHF